MADLKTRPTGLSVSAFINAIEDGRTRRDCQLLAKMMAEATGSRPKMWGPSIVGFGSYHYRYASGKEAEWPLTGFSPRKQNLTLYIMSGFEGYEDLLARLGKHKTGKACLYVRSLDDLDLAVLKRLIRASVRHMEKSSSRA
jgi:hypothetical protein